MSEKDIICVSNEVNTLRGKLVKELEEENKQLKDKNKHIEQWWKETNIIIRNDKPLAVNDNAMNYIESLEQKIDKAIEILKDTSVDMPSTLLMETIDYARHILGDKENE